MSSFYVDPVISRAQTLNKEFYTNPSVYEICKEKIFAPSWQYIGCTEQVAEAGQVNPVTLLPDYLDEPLLLTKDQQGFHLVSNVCTHRGNLIACEAGKTQQLRCKYHGRLFQLNGRFMSMPEFKEVENFPSESDNLKQLALYQWGTLLFSSLDPVHKATDFLGDMMKRVSWIPMDQLRYDPALSQDFLVEAHWALYCENYLEGFHIPFVHAGLNAVIDFGNYTTELFELSNLQLGIARHGDDCFDLPETSPDFGKQVAAYYFFVFPNMMFNFYPWGLSLNIVEPVGQHKTRVRFLSFILDRAKHNTGAGSGLDTVEREDEEVVENVQKGIRSRFYEHGRYSVNREQGTHHFHRMISKILSARSAYEE